VLIKRLHRNTVKRFAFTAAGILVGVGGIATGSLRDAGGQAAVTPAAATAEPATGRFEYRRLADPSRTVVTDATHRVVATLTDGARTTNVLGPSRSFAEPSGTAKAVTSQTWVRILPQAWTPGAEREPWFGPWLEAALRDRQPDVLETTVQYLHARPEITDAQGNRYGGDARYGVLDANADSRPDRSDFYDYLGKLWTFPDGRVELPDPMLGGAVDASGFIRLVFGYRSGIPLARKNSDEGIPRGASAMASKGPGTVVVPDRQLPVSEFGRLQPGDLVFFDTDPDRRVDTVGIYFGVDESGQQRFVASRAAADGPTMGDTGGAAVLNGAGEYSAAFRSVKRL
jgi:cell wall-associated NlpC family hydrolase